MLRGEFETDDADTAAERLAVYRAAVRDAVRDAGVERAAAATDLDEETVRHLADGEDVDLPLSAAAALLALADGRPDADAIEAEAQDILLMGMTTAVLDVDAVAGELDGDLDAKEIQQKIEGRHPMTLAEYARIEQVIESRK